MIMNRTDVKRIVGLCCLSIVLIFAILSVAGKVKAQSDNFALEAEEHWDTYRVGGTCISGSHNLFVADIDKDSQVEIVTGGSTYTMLSDGSTAPRQAPLRIWNWKGQNITLEFKKNWPGNINCVYANDVDNDGKVEMIISGNIRNETGTFPSLKVFNWDGSSLILKASVEGAATTDVFVEDVDKDGVREILSVGRFNISGELAGARLNAWHLKNNALELMHSVEWCVSNVTSAGSVYAGDLNSDGELEIVTTGYAYTLKNSSGQLRVWKYGEGGFALKSNEEWRLKDGVYALTTAGGVQGNTVANNLKVGDVDGDGKLEIVTGGFAFDGENINAQLRIWNWSDGKLFLETSEEWVTDYLTEVKCLSLSDVDGDSKVEIVTSGVVGASGSFAGNATTPEREQLRVWSWDGRMLTLESAKDWTIDEGGCAWNVATGDIDIDGTTEIVTVGCTYFSTLCDPDMRIWSLSTSSKSENLPSIYMTTIVVATALAVVGIILVLRRRKKAKI